MHSQIEVFISMLYEKINYGVVICELQDILNVHFINFNVSMCVCICAAVTEDLLAAVYVYYKQRNLTLQTRSLLLSFYSKLYLQEQGHTHIAR